MTSTPTGKATGYIAANRQAKAERLAAIISELGYGSAEAKVLPESHWCIAVEIDCRRRGAKPTGLPSDDTIEAVVDVLKAHEHFASGHKIARAAMGDDHPFGGGGSNAPMHDGGSEPGPSGNALPATPVPSYHVLEPASAVPATPTHCRHRLTTVCPTCANLDMAATIRVLVD